jgi:hypothetical protein
LRCKPRQHPESGIERLTFLRNQKQENVVIKSIQDHPRIENERDALKRFQSHTPYLRPLVDEIEEPRSPNTIALRYLQIDPLDTSIAKILNRKELKHVS